VSQPGSAIPFDSVALRVSVSPFGSEKVLAGMVKLRLASSAIVWSRMGLATIGGALVLVPGTTVMTKLSDTAAPRASGRS